jgi:hypothetical protein
MGAPTFVPGIGVRVSAKFEAIWRIDTPVGVRWFDYARHHTLEEAVDLLAEKLKEAKKVDGKFDPTPHLEALNCKTIAKKLPGHGSVWVHPGGSVLLAIRRDDHAPERRT